MRQRPAGQFLQYCGLPRGWDIGWKEAGTGRPLQGPVRSTAQLTIIKRYANRRLYNTRNGQYVSRKSLEAMARRGDDFVVLDTLTGEDITHSVLDQIIVAQEAVQEKPLLPSEFMRRLIGFMVIRFGHY
jgi:polyhydroxyalkanoate synthesis repressor PhaR